MRWENPPAGRRGQTRYGTHEFHWEVQVRWTFSFDCCLVWSEIGNKVINKEKENSHFLSWFQYLHPGFLRRNCILYSHLSKNITGKQSPHLFLCAHPREAAIPHSCFQTHSSPQGGQFPFCTPLCLVFIIIFLKLCFPVLEGKKKKTEAKAGSVRGGN